MPTDLGTYQEGETIPIRRETLDEDGTATPPSSLTFNVEEEGKSTVQHTLAGGDPPVETIGVGDYQLNFTSTQAGRVHVEIIMVSGTKVIVEHALAFVEPRNVAPPP